MAEGQDFSTVKKAMFERYSKRKIEAGIIREANEFCYCGYDIEKFFREVEKLYEDVELTKIAKNNLIMKAIHADQRILNFVLIRGDSTFEEVKKS